MLTTRKILATILAICMLTTVFGVSAAFADDAVFSNPGTYSASAIGKNGEVTVTATFSETAIEAIVYQGDETPEIGNVAMDQLKDAVLTNQTLNVDAITGATLSSSAFIMALMECVEQAGGSADALNAAIEEDSVDYVTEADVIVVGAGGAGITAAISAAEKGASVIVLEKSNFIGGNTMAAQSGINVSGSQLQKEAGIDYSIEQFVEMQTNELSRENLITRLAEKSGETVDWLVEQGADLAMNPDREYQVKIESTDTFTTIVVIEALKKSLEASGANLYMNIRATELVTDDNNNVTGVVAVDSKGNEITFNGKAVVLATGGFGKDHARVESLRPDFKYVTTDEIAPTTGDGLDMAVAIGAQTVDLDQLMAHPSVGIGIGMVAGNVAPGGRNIQAIIVNLNGERFFSENLYGGTPYVLEQPEGTAIMVFTEEYLNDFLRGYYQLGAVKRGETAADLAVELGIDPDALQATVDKWNEDVANGVDTVFGRESNLNPLEGPLYAYFYNPGIHYCMGGILINEDAQVLDTEDAPIAGLYAGGEVTGGVHGTTRVDGSALTDTFTFGRIAGQSAAEYALS